MFKPHPRATVVIATKNRKQELRFAIKSALEQDCPVLVVVVDDGSTDGTPEMICREFPNVLLVSHRESAGYISARNEAANIADSEFLFSLDDDATFSSASVVGDTIPLFEKNVGVVAIPFVNVNRNHEVNQLPPDSEEIYIEFSFVGTAYAVRRDLFVQLGGYRSSLFHQGEEEDFSIRMLNAGYVARLGWSDPIHHFESPKRDYKRMDVFGRRNQVLFGVHNVPARSLPLFLARVTARGVVEAARTGRWANMIFGIVLGYRDFNAALELRAPVSHECFRLFRQLRAASKRKTLYKLRDVLGNLEDRKRNL